MPLYTKYLQYTKQRLNLPSTAELASLSVEIIFQPQKYSKGINQDLKRKDTAPKGHSKTVTNHRNALQEIDHK